MMTEEPPFITVGADVSAKFKGAFCEATVKSAKKLVKCKVLLKNGTSCVVHDDQIEGPLKLNTVVKVKQEDGLQEGTIIKLTDNSLYTVVFDDGDEKTLRRTSLCLKGERHFQEDENLDNRPLNNPENFGAPVAKQKPEKSRKRTRLSSQNSDVEEEDDETRPESKKKRESLFGKVVCVELGERRKSWFPALCLGKHMIDGTALEKGHVLIQSFKDGRKTGICRDDVKEFSKDKEPLLSYIRGDTKIEPILRAAIEKALAYHDNGEIPRGWQVDFNEHTESSSSEEEESEEGEKKLSKEEEEFMNKLHKIMDDNGTPMSKPPLLGCKEINLYKLYQMVMESGGMDEVTNLAKWRTIYIEMGMTNPPTTASYNIRNFYKRYLYPLEAQEKGIDISDDKKESDKEKQRESRKEKEKEKSKKQESDSENEGVSRRLTRMQSKNESDSEVERRETRSSRPRRTSIDKSSNNSEGKGSKQVASPGESSDESLGSYLDMSSYSKRGDMEAHSDEAKHSEGDELVDIVNSPHSSVLSEDKEFSDTRSESEITMTDDGRYPVGARILVKYGKGKLHRAYEAKVIDVDSELTPDLLYYVHYRGWNHRYDEWIKHDFIEGLSPYPPKRKGASSKGAKGKDSTGGYKNHPEPPGIHNFHGSPAPTPRSTARSRKAGSPPPLQPITQPTHTPDKQPKSTHNTPKANTNTTTRNPPSSTTKATPPVLKQPITSQKVALPKPTASSSKASFAAQKIESPFVDIKPHPVKPRTTRNSMQDVFLITALEESISAKGAGGRRKGSPFHNPDSPASDTSAPGRPKRGRERPNQSPAHEEEESESSSAKEDDVESQERDRTPPQKKATRRKRKERSPYAKQDSKDSAEDESSLSEYPIERWGDDTKGAFGSKGGARGKTPDKKKEKPRSNRGRPASQRVKQAEESIHAAIPEYDRQSSAMAILSDCALMKKEAILLSNEEDLEEERVSPREEDMESDDVIMEQGKSAQRSHKRKNETKISHDKKVMKIEGGLSIGNSKQKIEKGDSMNVQKIEKGDSVNVTPSKLMVKGHFEEQHIDNINDGNVQSNKVKNENNNINECPIPDDNGLACMEHVVDILQQAAAIEAENQRKLNQGMPSPAHGKSEAVSEMRSPSGGHVTPDRRKKRKERKRRRRAPSCSVAEASESENGCLQSPFRAKRERNHSTVVLEKEKFDFVSDLGELAELEAAERIRVIQSRIYEIQKLYGKLKTELASMERRKRRKLRKQSENVNRSMEMMEGK